jgi:hypothetical protein
MFFGVGAMSGWVLVLTGCTEERRTGPLGLRVNRSASATGRQGTLARRRQELAIVLGRYGGTGRNACATETRGYYSVPRADILSRR